MDLRLPAPPAPVLVAKPNVVSPQSAIDGSGMTIVSWLVGATWAPKSTVRPREFLFYGLSHSLGDPGWFWSEEQDEVVPVEPGDIVMTTPGLKQDYGSPGPGYREDAIAFAGPMADLLAERGLISAGIYRFGTDRPLAAAVAHLRKPGHSTQVRAQAKLLELLADLHDLGPGTVSGRHDFFGQLLEEIHDDPMGDWSPAALASYSGLSERHLRREFTARVGTSPKRYVDSVRMQRAAEVLRSTTRPVEDIAAEHGYSDQDHFSRRFRDWMGESPTQHRTRDPLRSRH